MKITKYAIKQKKNFIRCHPEIWIIVTLYVIAYQFWGWQWHTVSMWIYFAVLITASLIDYQYKIIPDEIILTGFVLGVQPVLFSGGLIDGLIGFFAAGLLLLTIALISKGGMGGGDIKLSALMGLFLGWPCIIVALFMAFLAGGISGVLQIAMKRKDGKDTIPFGPYLALGGVLAAFYGDLIIRWYLG